MTRKTGTEVPRTLRLGVSLMRRGHLWLLVGGLIVIPVVLIGALILVLHRAADEERDIFALLREAWLGFLREPGNEWMLWALVIAVPAAVLLALIQRSARIRLTSTGLQARIPGLLAINLLGQTPGRWEVLWESVRRVRLEAPADKLKGVKRIGWYRLVIETGEEEIRINPFAWHDPAGPDHRLRIGELLRPLSMDADRRVRDAPLIEAVAARGFELEAGEVDWKPPGTDFNLARHAGMVVLLVVFFIAALYAIADTYIVSSYRAIEPLPLMPFLEAGVVTALGALLLGGGAPRLERVVVGTMTTIAVVAAVHPAVLRYNAATAEPEIVRYRAVAPGSFEDPRETRPPVDLSDVEIEEYWAAHPAGSTHELTLLRGDAGFYQIDLAPLYARTRSFYESRPGSQESG